MVSQIPLALRSLTRRFDSSVVLCVPMLHYTTSLITAQQLIGVVQLACNNTAGKQF